MDHVRKFLDDSPGGIVLDIEADGMLEEATRIHCASMLSINTGFILTVTSHEEVLYALLHSDLVVGHNLTGYDLPLLLRLLPQPGGMFREELRPYPWAPSYRYLQELLSNPEVDWIKDTYEMSVALKPERQGGHSVEAWANRLGVGPKVEIDDWQGLPIERYIERCEMDVKIEMEIYKALNMEIEELLDEPFGG